jgi:hypothetical protein
MEGGAGDLKGVFGSDPGGFHLATYTNSSALKQLLLRSCWGFCTAVCCFDYLVYICLPPVPSNVQADPTRPDGRGTASTGF